MKGRGPRSRAGSRSAPVATSAERRDLALERLARGNERWLLVLDNIDSPGQLPDCLPLAGNGRVLVTSRNREVLQFAPVLPLDVFDPEIAFQYLTERGLRLTKLSRGAM